MWVIVLLQFSGSKQWGQFLGWEKKNKIWPERKRRQKISLGLGQTV